MITYFKKKYHESKQKMKKFKTFPTKLKAGDTFVDTATNSTSVTIIVTLTSLVVLRKLTGATCGLTIATKLYYETNSCNYTKHQTQLNKSQ